MSESDLCVSLAVFIVATLFRNNVVRVRDDGAFFVTYDDIYTNADFACGYPLLLDKLFDEFEVNGVDLVEKV